MEKNEWAGAGGRVHREFVMADNIFFKFNTIIIFGVDNAISISIHFLVCNFFFFIKVPWCIPAVGSKLSRL